MTADRRAARAGFAAALLTLAVGTARADTPPPAASAAAPLIEGLDFGWVDPPMPAPPGRNQVIVFLRPCTTAAASAWAAARDLRGRHHEGTQGVPYPGVLRAADVTAARLALAAWRVGGGRAGMEQFLDACAQAPSLVRSAPDLRDWVRAQGWGARDFTRAANGDWVLEHVVPLPDLMRAYGITVLPTAVVNGRYRVPWNKGMTIDRFRHILRVILRHAATPPAAP